MDPQKFDGISRALASGTSRRSVLRGLLGTAMGGALGLVGVTKGSTQPGKVGICHVTDSSTNPMVYIQVSTNALATHAAHGDLTSCPGAGYIDPESCTCACDLECEGNFEVDEGSCACVCNLTCEGNFDLDAATCTCVCNEVCEGNYEVDEETCSCFCPVDEIVCEEGQFLNAETCACEDSPDPECAGATCTTFIPCDTTNPDCVCTTLVNGGGLCVPGSTNCSILAACGADGSCPEGSLCAVDTCCGSPVCIPIDLECSGAGATFRTFSDGGPTIGGQ
jgi:hypothetical protein